MTENYKRETTTSTTMKTSFCAAAIGFFTAGVAAPSVKASAITAQVGGDCFRIAVQGSDNKECSNDVPIYLCAPAVNTCMYTTAMCVAWRMQQVCCYFCVSIEGFDVFSERSLGILDRAKLQR